MPFETLRIIPSVDVEKTPADNASGISESNFIRWRDKIPEKRGGCTFYTNTQYAGTPKDLHAWTGLLNDKRLAIATTARLYIQSASLGTKDLTPIYNNVDIPPSIATVNGSSIVTVTDNLQANVSQYDTVVFNTPCYVRGVYLAGAYQVIAGITTNTYTIDAGIPATSTGSGGVVPQFVTVQGQSEVTVNITGNPYQPGDQVSFNVETIVGGITIFGTYIVLQDSFSAGATFKFNANKTATSDDTQYMNYQNAPDLLNLTYWITLGPAAPGQGYGVGFYTSYTETKVATTASTATIGLQYFATVNYTGSSEFNAGETAVVSGVSVGGYNGSWTITSIGAGSITYEVPGTLGAGTGGSISVAHSSGGYGTGIVPPLPSGIKLPATNWTTDNWGETLIACPQGGPLFYWSVNSGYFNASIISTGPLVNEGCFVSMPQQQLMAYGSTYGSFQDPLQIRWSDVEDYFTWTPTSINQAGGYRIPTGSKIVRGIQGPTQQYWFTDVDLYVSQYIGTPFIYGFNKIGTGCGLIAQKAVAGYSTSLYWMSQKQFFVVSASGGVQPIPCSVWDYVFQNLNLNYTDNIIAGANAQFNEVNWFFPSATSTNGVPDSYVCYNVLYNEWDYGKLSRTAWIDQSILGGPLSADADGYVYEQETSNTNAGNPINAYFTTGYFSLTNGNDLVFVDWMLPDMRWGGYAAAQNAQLTVYFNVVDYPGDTPTQYGPFIITKDTDYIEPRFRGRYVQIIVQSGAPGVPDPNPDTFWRLGSFRYRYATSGRR